MKKLILIILICFAQTSCATTTDENIVKKDPAFEKFVKNLKVEAKEKGISEQTIEEAFANVSFNKKLIKLDRNQPEVKKTFAMYLEQVVNDYRIKKGQEFYKNNKADLVKIGNEYGVPAEYITALLGVETNYGKNFGNSPVINSLTTMAYDKRRSTFFKKELFHALRILDENHIELEDMKGSWAGAMGQNQFMPSSFFAYAVDYNKDGKKDIWTSKEDVFASTANYLSSYKFNPKEKWGRAVTLPKDFDESLLGLKIKKKVDDWQKIGVRNAEGNALPVSCMEGSIIAPDGLEGPAYLAYNNFRVFLRWNRSLHFATSVGMLADEIKAGN